ncbi:MAG TPA: dihydropteroate synthase, partial [Vicinamibacterales bacterium]|nr:dihydropteroate synthase [Vicinamibacterales bacterium]
VTTSYPPFASRRTYRIPLAHGAVLELGVRPLVMGILNVTPDSFAETRPLEAAEAVERALAIQADGADIIDIGGESTRPGADPVDADVELGRILPVIEQMRGRLRIPISVDTYKARVADAAIEAGAHMVNDVSGLLYDPTLARVVAKHGASIVLMHTRGRSRDMYDEAEYADVAQDVATELRARVETAVASGVPLTSIVVDPGVGFAKRAAHSYGVLARLREIGDAIGRPVLVGPSRKSFMRAAAGGADAPERDWTTAAAVTAAVFGGAHIVRVHAVGPMVQVVRAAEEIRHAR